MQCTTSYPAAFLYPASKERLSRVVFVLDIRRELAAFEANVGGWEVGRFRAG